MKVNSMNSFEELPQFEVIDEYWSGGFDNNIQDVGVVIEDVNTGQRYNAEYAYFEHGIDEYYIDEKSLTKVEN